MNMTIVMVDTYEVGKTTFVEHEKFINDVFLPAMKRLDKRLKSLSYFSCISAQSVGSMGGRMMMSEYDSLADLEKSIQELQASEEGRKLSDRFAELIDTSTDRTSLWTAGSWELYKYLK
jgi:hypothetical protein